MWNGIEQMSAPPMSGKKITIADLQRLQRQSQRPTRLTAGRAEDLDDQTIALAVNKKRKGWAWRRDQAINFSDPANSRALISWASTQPFFHTHATGQWNKGNVEVRWIDVYTDLCLTVAEHQMKPGEHAQLVKSIIAAAIRSYASADKGNHGCERTTTEGDGVSNTTAPTAA